MINLVIMLAVGMGIGILGILVFRKKLGAKYSEKWIRILFTAQLIPTFVILLMIEDEWMIKAIFSFSLVGGAVFIWKTQIFCKNCFGIVLQSFFIQSKFCRKCGKELGDIRRKP